MVIEHAQELRSNMPAAHKDFECQSSNYAVVGGAQTDQKVVKEQQSSS